MIKNITFRFILLLTILVFARTAHTQTNVVPDEIEFQVLKAIYDNMGGAVGQPKPTGPRRETGHHQPQAHSSVHGME